MWFQIQAPHRVSLSFISPSFYFVYRQLQVSQTGQLPGETLRRRSTSDSPPGSESDFISCCFLDLDVNKTKDLVSDFRRNGGKHKASTIHGNEVEVVETYKYLSCFWFTVEVWQNIESTVKRGQQRIHLLRKLNSFNVCNKLRVSFISLLSRVFELFPSSAGLGLGFLVGEAGGSQR